MAQLVDGAVATGAGAFSPGQIVVRAPSPDWPEQLPDDDADEFPLDPVLKGPAGRVDPPSGAPQTPKLSSLDISMDTSRSGDNSDDDIEVRSYLSHSIQCFYIHLVVICLTPTCPRDVRPAIQHLETLPHRWTWPQAEQRACTHGGLAIT